MAQIGYGYGSEYQLLRFLGHHRNDLEESITRVIGEGKFFWMDFNYANPKKVISGDQELSGLTFLENFFPNKYSSIKAVYETYKINNRNHWQSWDAVFIHNDTLYLVEAKAHVSELCSGKKEHGDNSKDEILRYFKEQLPNLPVTRVWLGDYYQLANRLATAALLNKQGVKTKILYIYFVNGYRKRVVEKINDTKERIFETLNMNATKEQFEEAINKEMSALGIDKDSVSDILAPSVFVDAEPIPTNEYSNDMCHLI